MHPPLVLEYSYEAIVKFDAAVGAGSALANRRKKTQARRESTLLGYDIVTLVQKPSNV